MVAIGPERFTLPFGAVGFEMVEADEAGFAEAFEAAARDHRVGLIVCGESFVGEPPGDEFRELCQMSRAAVMIVPDGPEPKGVGLEMVRAAIERAAGVDLLSATEADEEKK